MNDDDYAIALLEELHLLQDEIAAAKTERSLQQKLVEHLQEEQTSLLLQKEQRAKRSELTNELQALQHAIEESKLEQAAAIRDLYEAKQEYEQLLTTGGGFKWEPAVENNEIVNDDNTRDDDAAPRVAQQSNDRLPRTKSNDFHNSASLPFCSIKPRIRRPDPFGKQSSDKKKTTSNVSTAAVILEADNYKTIAPTKTANLTNDNEKTTTIAGSNDRKTNKNKTSTNNETTVKTAPASSDNLFEASTSSFSLVDWGSSGGDQQTAAVDNDASCNTQNDSFFLGFGSFQPSSTIEK